jgi:hypothetical protein
MDPELKQHHEKLNTMVVVRRKPFDELMRMLVEEDTSYYDRRV